MTDVRDARPGVHDREPGGGIGAWLGLMAILAGLGFLAVWSLWAFAIVGSLVVIVFLHEMGHYLAARATGMKATEFFLGFGPRIWSFRRGDTTFGIKAIWAGAYVKVIGMNELDEVDDPADEPRTYRQASYPKKLLLAGAGSAMHFVLAILLLFTLFAVTGVRDGDAWDPADWAVGTVLAESGADGGGIEPGDRIVAVDGIDTPTFLDMRDVVQARPGETVPVVVERDGAELDTTVQLRAVEAPDGSEVGQIGVSQRALDVPVTRDPPAEAAGHAVTEFGTLVWESLKGIGNFVANFGDFIGQVFSAPGEDDEQNLEARPVSLVGVVQIGSDAGSDIGFRAVIEMLALLNVFLGVFNLLPLLPLDGGHIAIATYERIRSTRDERYVADITKVLPIAYAAFLALVFLGAGSLWLDITSPIRL